MPRDRTVPVVRATGGLEDTVEQWDPRTRTGTGFKFDGYTAPELLAAMHEALSVFPKKEDWKQLMLNGMRQNFSWDQPAREYVEVYEKAKALHLHHGDTETRRTAGPELTTEDAKVR